jgi:NAD(P)-dependent dehydrogenase (short-subunit alcohol dehydrogenase family)
MKTAIITGANSGIGKVTALELARLNYRIVMVCRNPQKAKAARQEIVDETGNSDIFIEICDLSLMVNIVELGKRIRQSHSTIDLLVNNAGLLPQSERQTTNEGLEMTFAVNHLAYFLLTREMMPSLTSAKSARIINVASEAHRSGTFDPENVQLKTGYSAMKAYGNSKLFNIMFTSQLHNELHEGSVTTYSLHPGVVDTNFASSSDSFFATLFNLGRFFMLSPKKGAATSIYLCTEPGIEPLSGRYFIKSKPAKPSSVARNDEACKHLWDLSEKLVYAVI